MNTVNRSRRKRWLAAGFFLLILLLTVGPLTLLRSPAPAAYVNGIAVCEPEYNPGPSSMAQAQFEEDYPDLRAQLENKLENSENPDARVVSILLKNRFDDRARISALEALATDYPENKLLHMHYLSLCSENADYADCVEPLVDSALELNRENAVAWSLVAIYRDATGNVIGSDRALAAAVNAPQFIDYYGEQIEVMLDTIPVSNDFSELQLRYAVVGEATGLLLKYSYQLSYLCGNANPSRIQLFESCANFGERMYEESNATIMSLVGSSIAEVGYRRMGDSQNAIRMEQLYEDYTRRRSDPESDASVFNSMGGLLTYDLNLSRFWLDAIVQYGEQGAMSATVAEARRLSSDPSYAPCVIR